MGRFSRLTALLVLSVIIALALSRLPQLEHTVNTGAKQTIAAGHEQLTEQNLVDALEAIPLGLTIVRADIRQSVLSVDLGIAQGKMPEYAVYDDLYELSQYALTSTANIEQVLVRIMEVHKEDPKSRQLLLAMDARRENRPKSEGKAVDSSKLQTKELIQAHYALTFTQKWNDAVVQTP